MATTAIFRPSIALPFQKIVGRGRSAARTVQVRHTPAARTTATKRTFFSNHKLGSRFTPLEEFVLDVSAWALALSLWYAPRMEFDGGEEHNPDAHLEYREDYGPTLSSYETESSSKDPSRNKKHHKPNE
jgi:hypothetical protein